MKSTFISVIPMFTVPTDPDLRVTSFQFILVYGCCVNDSIILFIFVRSYHNSCFFFNQIIFIHRVEIFKNWKYGNSIPTGRFSIVEKEFSL